jgi:hypothetical protein
MPPTSSYSFQQISSEASLDNVNKSDASPSLGNPVHKMLGAHKDAQLCGADAATIDAITKAALDKLREYPQSAYSLVRSHIKALKAVSPPPGSYTGTATGGPGSIQ